MGTEYSDLVGAFRAGLSVEELMRDFQEQLLDAHTEYIKEQEAEKAEAQKAAEEDLEDIRENLAVDLLEWCSATQIIPAKILDNIKVDDVIEVIKSVEEARLNITKANEEMKEAGTSFLNFLATFF